MRCSLRSKCPPERSQVREVSFGLRFRTWLYEQAELTEEEEDEISAGVKKLLNEALSRAEESPLPDPAKLADGVYATPEDLDTPHHK